MDDTSPPWFQFMVDDYTRQRVYVPNKFRNVLQTTCGEYFLVNGNQTPPTPVTLRPLEAGPIWKCFIQDGWTTYVEENDIRNGDVVEIYYFGSRYLMLRVFRNGKMVLGEDEDVDSTDEDMVGGVEFDNNPATFTAKFTRHYINSGRLYVPVSFARENFQGYPEETHVQMVMGKQVWDAILGVEYNGHQNIVRCLLKRGVTQMIHSQSIYAGQMVEAEFYGDVTPPLFYIRKCD